MGYLFGGEGSAITGSIVDGAPSALDTLNELAAALNDDANFAGTVTTALAAKAPLNSPTFTGTVAGITKSMVGLGNVDNTTDANKPISSATQTALDAKANIDAPVFTTNITTPAVVSSNIAGELTIAGTTTTGSLRIGGSFTSGAINIGTGTTWAGGSINIGTGALSSGSKAINIGTGSITGGASQTITIGNGNNPLNLAGSVNVTAGSMSVGTILSSTASAGNLFNNVTGAVDIGAGAATSIAIGRGLTTGVANIATGDTFAGTVNIATGALTSGTKTISIGTGASAPANSTVTIGSTGASASIINLNGTVYANATTFVRAIENGNGNANAVNLFASQTANTVSIAGGNSFNGTLSLAGGSTTSGNKTLNIGTGGGVGSSTLIRLGASTPGANSTIFINGNPVLTNPTVPGSATATGTAGQIAWDANYFYVCTATNTWVRTALATW